MTAPNEDRGPCLPLDTPVPPGGYAWWYFDAESDCGRYGLCIIAFAGSVFSPHYARARARQAPAAADAHLAVNVALYGQHRGWIFCEEGRPTATRTSTVLGVHGARLQRTAGGYVVDVEARRTPGLGRLVGRVSFVLPDAAPRDLALGAPWRWPHRLDAAGRHAWWPVAPACQVDVLLSCPHARWSGRAYHDANCGEVPLADDFSSWSWLRAWHPEGTLVLYTPRALPARRAARPLAALFGHDGRVQAVEAPSLQAQPRSRWGLTPYGPAGGHTLARLEDTPFYTRAKLLLPWQGQQLAAYHEYLDLVRWRAAWVQFLLGFRLRRQRPRRA